MTRTRRSKRKSFPLGQVSKMILQKVLIKRLQGGWGWWGYMEDPHHLFGARSNEHLSLGHVKKWHSSFRRSYGWGCDAEEGHCHVPRRGNRCEILLKEKTRLSTITFRWHATRDNFCRLWWWWGGDVERGHCLVPWRGDRCNFWKKEKARLSTITFRWHAARDNFWGWWWRWGGNVQKSQCHLLGKVKRCRFVERQLKKHPLFDRSIFPWIFEQFFNCPKQIHNISMKLEQSPCLYFFKEPRMIHKCIFS